MTTISAVICTHNRARLLDAAIASLAGQTLPPDAYEILVVDNASTDETRSTVEKWMRRCPNLRYVYEPRLGLSHARNRGSAQARAPIVAFLDDDARAGEEWLEHLCGGFGQTPRPAVVGGPISLNWEGGRAPSWMSKHLMYQYGLVDHSDSPGPVAMVNGGNMAIDKNALDAYGGFKTNLGRRGDRLLYGEEFDLVSRLRRKGAIIYYAPKARVEHFVPVERQKAAFILRATYGKGMCLALMYSPREKLYHGTRLVLRVLLFVLRLWFFFRQTSLTATLAALLSELALVFGFILGIMAPRRVSE